MSCSVELLESWLDGELTASAAVSVERHAEECVGCARELAWLRAERALMAERVERREAPEELWKAVARGAQGNRSAKWEARSDPPQERPEWEGRSRWAAAAGALAASLLVVGSFSGRVDPQPSSALAVAAVDTAGWVEQLYGACLIAFPRDSMWCSEDGPIGAYPSEPLASFSVSR